MTGKRICLVGSGPGSSANKFGFVDSHDVIVRVNNYKLDWRTGSRTDVFYSYFGKAVKKTPEDLKRDGVKLCMAKCPDAKFMDSPWHASHGRESGVDFRWIYERRKYWWFCDTYIPTLDEFMKNFRLLGGHVPTTGFAALLDILSYDPEHIYMTGFDFFTSRIHNLNERWKPSKVSDPIGHVPITECEWLKNNRDRIPVSFDKKLKEVLGKDVVQLRRQAIPGISQARQRSSVRR